LRPAGSGPERIAAAHAQLGVVLGDYDMTALITLVNLALDQGCRMPEPALLALTQDAAVVPAMLPSSRQAVPKLGGIARPLVDAARATAGPDP